MFIRVGINGFGRIGRIVLRTCLQNPDLQIAAINDPALDVEYICYLIKFDSTHGKLDGSIAHNNNEIILNDNIVIRVYNEKSPPEIPWHLAGVNYVVEASGMFTTMEKAMGHLINDCVRQVIVTAPSIDIPMIILGVNEEKLSADQRIISAGSSTLYCLAPIIKILEDKFGVIEGFVTSIHAMTPSMKPLDGLCLRGKHWRDHRSAVQNIIPAATGACKALGKIIPKAKDKLTGLAFRVPIVNVSVLDLSVKLATPTSLESIAKEVETASRSYMKNIVKVSNDEAVSSDFMKDSHSCILDLDASLQLRPTSFKLICWYENEYSYASRVIDYITINEDKLKHRTPVATSCCSKVVIKKHSKSSYLQNFKGDARENVSVTAAKNCIRGIPEKVSVIPSQITPLSIKNNIKEDNTLNSVTSRNNAQELNQTSRFLKKTKSLNGPWSKRKYVLESCVDTSIQKKNRIFYDFGARYTENLDSVRPHQEHLEKIKQHFNKVANITEALLKKSCSRKFNPTSKSLASDLKTVSVNSDEGPKNNLDNNNIEEKGSKKTLSEYNILNMIPSRATSRAFKRENEEDVIIEEDSQLLCVTNFDSVDPVEDTLSIVPSTKQIKDEDNLNVGDPADPDSDNIFQISENKNYCMESLSSGSSKGCYFISPKNYTETVEAPNLTENNKKEHEDKIKSNQINITNNFPIPETIDASQNISDDVTVSKSDSPKLLNFILAHKADVTDETVEKNNLSNDDVDCCPFLDLKTKIDDVEANEIVEPNEDTELVEETQLSSIKYDVENEVEDQSMIKTSTKTVLSPSNKDDIIEVEPQPKLHSFGTLDNTDASGSSSVQLTRPCSKDKIIYDETMEVAPQSIADSFGTLDNGDPSQCPSIQLATNSSKEKNMYEGSLEAEPQSTSHLFGTLDNTDPSQCPSIQLAKTSSKEKIIYEGGKDEQLATLHSFGALDNTDPSQCPSIQLTSSSKENIIYEGKSDIYDKLDSKSASDASENSFIIEEKKSQILEIKDVSKSLEDLDRMDKLCRIMEISDDLSDRLFSNLNTNGSDVTPVAGRAWSFNDMCKKINFDEFCDNLFSNDE